MPARVVIAEHDSTARDRIREIVGSGGHEIVGLARDGQEAMQMCMELNPQIAFIAHDLPGISGEHVCGMVSALRPSVMIVLMVDSTTMGVAESAMHEGARALLVRPGNSETVEELIADLSGYIKWRKSADVMQWSDPSRYPKIITITGAKGGVGKSTIGVNLAVLLADTHPDQVALLDLYTQFGDIATMFDIVPQRTIADIIQAGDEMDGDLVRSCAVKHQSGVDVYITADNPIALDAISTERLDSLLYILRRSYRYVIIDVPPILNGSTIHVMAHSNRILLIANLFDLTTATDTKKLFTTLQREMIPKENIGIVLNRTSKSNRLQSADLESVFDSKVLAQIPNDSRLVNTINQGSPLAMSDGESAIIASLRQLALQITGVDNAAVSMKPAGVRGLFKAKQGA